MLCNSKYNVYILQNENRAFSPTSIGLMSNIERSVYKRILLLIK